MSKRKELNDLSKMMKELVKSGVYNSLNEALLNFYAEHENLETEDFKTFYQWKKEGFFVKKNSQAFLIWGTPISSKNDKGEDLKFFPMCFLFSKHQVEKLVPKSEKALIPQMDLTA
jgi:hypothetical protein